MTFISYCKYCKYNPYISFEGFNTHSKIERCLLELHLLYNNFKNKPMLSLILMAILTIEMMHHKTIKNVNSM